MNKISVNITTTLNRQHLCSQTVWSLLNQSFTPKTIRIWASKEPYLIDKGFPATPEWVNDLNKIKSIIEFRWTPNIGPYRKLIPALREASADEIIVYADDDTLYQENWLKLLISKFNEHDGRFAVAARVRKKRKSILGGYTTYMLWPIVMKELTLSENFLVTGIGGAVLRRSHIKEQYIQNNDFLKICPKADDFWISEILNASDTEVVTVPEALEEIIPIEHPLGLSEDNRLNAKSIFTKIANKIKINTAGRLGVNLCKNDDAQKLILKYRQSKEM